ncbi:MAG: hypothetical protein H6736_08180 [Alphaproteobacteria bacterium]|nr:hypothetical protein [Alphaproteobacteria bacterium]
MSALPADLRPSTALDLHLHTSASDGRYDLDEVLRRCARGGLDVVAITDHDLARHLQTGPVEVEGRTLHVIAGAEVSGVHEGREHHLLVYFPARVPDGFVDFCNAQCDARRTRFEDAMRALAVDLPTPPDARALTRLHLARALVEAGVVETTADAFVRHLGDAHGFVPRLTLPFVEAIRIARAFGGITSWAHPPRVAVEAHLSTFVSAGLQGLELVRPNVPAADRKALKKLARRQGLFLTGGSDWHGWTGPEPGLFRVDAARIAGFVDALRAA